MSKLSAFLHPVSVQEEKEVVISSRFVKRGEDGKPLLDKNGNTIPEPFKVRAITQEENEMLSKKATRKVKVNGQYQDYFDNIAYSRSLVVLGTVEPDFSSKEMGDAYGVMDPNLIPGKMLLSGEYAKLLQAIVELSGLEDDLAAEEAKN